MRTRGCGVPECSAAWVRAFRLARRSARARTARCCQQRGVRDDVPATASFSDKSAASSISKAVVGALTAAVNALAPAPRDPAGTGTPRAGVEELLSPEQVRSAIELDFTEGCYLWTGEVTAHVYDADCEFTDPTLSFKGLATFQRNLANLRPLVDRFVRGAAVELHSCELLQNDTQVEAKWRMTGSFNFPWRPKLDIEGRTVYTLAPDAGNRIISYDESWSVPAGQALLQLLKPGS